MKKKLLIAGAVVAILIVGGIAFWLISPFWLSTKVEEAFPMVPASEEVGAHVITTSTVAILSQGSFVGFDAVHHGKGTASIIDVDDKTYVRFEEDFSVANGPDLFVGFGKDGEYSKKSEVGRLKGDKGSQNYELPDGFDSEKYNEVWIWCRAFGVPFAKAELK